jgi:cyanophycinase-like exopeptidase
MAGNIKGTLIIIGGAEDKIGNKAILEEVARFIGPGKLVITAVTSAQQREPSEEYDRIFNLTDRRPEMRSKPLAKENQQKAGQEPESMPKKAKAKG